MAKRKLRIIVRIGPTGLNEIDPPRVYFSNRKEECLECARGEGQALRFVLEDGDCSPNFYEALENGELLEFLRSKIWKLVQEERGNGGNVHD